ncbi:MAG: NrfA- nitrite reduction protein, partial [Myxococcota bacterium]
NDSHPRTKFTDPRNADRVAILDARWCVTCHQEHRPEVTGTMGLSLPGDYCFHCHQSIGEERPTHEGLAYDSCADVGCHNFHDNRGLYEDFLVDHRNEPALLESPRVPLRNLAAVFATEAGDHAPLEAKDQDATASSSDPIVEEWAASGHARGGVNCSECHGAGATWTDHPQVSVCEECHALEVEGFSHGRHGMRRLVEGAPMTKGEARLPMTPKSPERDMDCHACHPAHAYDTRAAAVSACLDCHADEHSRAYEGSPHHELWKKEEAGEAPAGSGVSCATCHLPRVETEARPDQILVAHNQNDYLRPREKMIRSVCIHCHGLAYTIDALADEALVESNYREAPQRSVRSMEYATELRWELEGRAPPFALDEDQRKDGEEKP